MKLYQYVGLRVIRALLSVATAPVWVPLGLVIVFLANCFEWAQDWYAKVYRDWERKKDGQ